MKYFVVLSLAGLLFTVAACHREEVPVLSHAQTQSQTAVVSPQTAPVEAKDEEAQPEEMKGEDAQKPRDANIPIITALAFRDPVIRGGQSIELVPEWQGTQDVNVSFDCQWFVNGEPVLGQGLILDGHLVKKGVAIRARVTPTVDGKKGEPFFGKELIVPNAPPAFVSTPELQFRSEDYLYEAKAEDPDGDALVYVLDSAPSGMTIDAASGLVRWGIGNRQAGEHRIRISARDTEGKSAVQEYVLTVTIEQESP